MDLSTATIFANDIVLQDPGTGNYTIQQGQDSSGLAGGHFIKLTGTISGAVDSARTLAFSNQKGVNAPITFILEGANTHTATTMLNDDYVTLALASTFTGTGADNAGFVIGGAVTMVRPILESTNLTIASGGSITSTFQRLSLGESGGSGSAFYLDDGITFAYKVNDSNNRDLANSMNFTIGMKNAGTANFSGSTAVDLRQRTPDAAKVTAWDFTAVSGATANFTGKIINSYAILAPITKTGDGYCRFAGDNTYTGTTTIDAGTLLVDGDSSGATRAVTVSSGGTLGGGVVGDIDTLTVNGNLSATSGTSNSATWLVDLNNTSTDVIALGDLSIGSRTFDISNFALSVNDIGSITQGNIYNIATYTGSMTGGAFNNYAQDAEVTGGNGHIFRIDYNTAGVIRLTAIPEPATLLPLASLLVAGFSLIRRRRNVGEIQQG